MTAPADAPPAPRRIEYLRLDELPEALHNPKGHDLVGIAAAVRLNGFVEPVLLGGRTGRLVGGHGRKEVLTGMMEAGEPVPEGVLVDDDGMWRAPVVSGWSSANDAAAEAMLIGLNQLPLAGGWDQSGLLEPIGRIEAAGLDLAALGFDDDALDDLRAELDEALVEPDGDSKYQQIDPETGVAPNESSMGERLNEYTIKGVRSVIVDLDLATYGWFAEHAPAARATLGVSTNADLLLAAVADAAGVPRLDPLALGPANDDGAVE